MLAVYASIAVSFQRAFGADSDAATADYDANTDSAQLYAHILQLPAFDPTEPFTSGDVVEYQRSFQPDSILPRRQYLDDGSRFRLESPATHLPGNELDDDVNKLEGRWIEGVMIVAVVPDGPGARAGLRGRRVALQRLLDGAALAGSVFFPPAVVAVPLLEEMQISESHDLIVGVGGERTLQHHSRRPQTADRGLCRSGNSHD